MISLAQEGIEAFEAVARSDWHGVYNLTGKGSTEYYPELFSGAWRVTTTVSFKTVTVDGVAYSRWAIVDNVCRDDTSRNIITTSGVPPCTSGNSDDPSTQKITMNVTTTGQPNVSIARYIARARNTTASQTSWSGGSGQATNPTSGFDAIFNTQYDSNDSNVDTATAGSIKILTQ